MIELKFANCDHSRDPIVGCALEGVASILAGIKGASMVIHSPQGCAATVGMAYDSHEIDFTRRKVACTRLFESDIVMGASQKLKDLIAEADKTFGAKSMFVVGTCAADIIGESLSRSWPEDFAETITTARISASRRSCLLSKKTRWLAIDASISSLLKSA
jgi:nitrogenase molybdenum-iron protein alpha/beta subunit